MGLNWNIFLHFSACLSKPFESLFISQSVRCLKSALLEKAAFVIYHWMKHLLVGLYLRIAQNMNRLLMAIYQYLMHVLSNVKLLQFLSLCCLADYILSVRVSFLINSFVHQSLSRLLAIVLARPPCCLDENSSRPCLDCLPP